MAATDSARIVGRASDRLIGAVWGDEAHRGDARVARRRRLALAGVVAVTAVSALASALHALAIPPFTPPDETAHLAYALAALDGEIPRIDDFPEALPIPHMRPGLSVWVANHPPLVYALLGLPLRAAEALGAPLAGLYLVRLAMVLSAAVGYLLVGWFAVLLLPGRPGAAVVATGLAATVPNNVHVAGLAYTDAPAFAVITGLLVAALVVLRRGVTTRRAVVLTVLAVLAVNFRVAGVAAAAGCLGCLVLAELLHGRAARWWRLARGAALTAVSGAITALSAAWFYVGVNLARYDSLTGSSALMALHGREPRATTLAERLVDPAYLRLLVWQYWGRLEADALGDAYVPEAMTLAGRWVIAALLLAAVLVGLWRLAAGSWRRSWPSVLCWAVAIGWFAALVVAMADFVQEGGGPHLRYLWPAVGTVAVLLAAGLAALPRRWGAIAGGVVVVYQLAVGAVALVGLGFRPEERVAPNEPAPTEALRALAVDAPAGAVAVLVAAGVVALAVLTVWARSAAVLLPGDDRGHLAPHPQGRAVSLARVTVRPLDVALAAVAGSVLAWFIAYQLEVVVSLPLLVPAVVLAAAVVGALAARRADAAVAASGSDRQGSPGPRTTRPP